jgi:hypothetical protein
VTDLEVVDTRIRDSALIWREAFASVIWVRADGTKVPGVAWKPYRETWAEPDQLEAWFPPGTPRGVGILTGTVARIEMLECEAEAVRRGFIERIRDLLVERGRADIWELLAGTYVEVSPSGGIHWYYRVDGTVKPNTKLASRPATPAELQLEPLKTTIVLVETRGTGGYSVVAPSGGKVHKTGRPWVARDDRTPFDMVELTEDQVDQVHAVCRLVDEMPTPAPKPAREIPTRNGVVPAALPRTGSVGGDYCAAHRLEDLLTERGWTCTGGNGSSPGTQWRKPGSDGPGHHATLGLVPGVDRVKVFSTAAPVPESGPGTSYDAFGFVVHSDYAGDFSRAARELAATGRYGVQTKAAGTRQTAGGPVGDAAHDTRRDEQESAPVTDNPDAAVIPIERARKSDDIPPPPEPPESDIPGNLWAPVDLTEILAGDFEPERATLLERDDGQCLLYPARVHSMHGESESGKSMMAQKSGATEIEAGHDVLYLDYESDARSVVARLIALGASREKIGRHLFYLNPDVAPGVDPAGLALLLARRYTLAVIDGVTDALCISGHSGLSNEDVTLWLLQLPKRIAKATGAAVIMVDHVVKNPESQGRFAIGGQAKMAGLTGAAYTVDVKSPLGRGLVGMLTLRIGKDRPGGVRPSCGSYRKTDRTQLAAVVTFDATDPEHIVVTVGAPGAESGEAGTGAWRPTALMERVSDAIAAATGPVTYTHIRDRVSGKREHVRTATDALIAEGYVTTADGMRGAVLHSNHHRYWQAKDPESDRFAEGARSTGPESDS